MTTNVPDMQALTWCIWVRADLGQPGGTLISYYVPSNNNELLIYDVTKIEFHVDLVVKTTSLNIDDCTWHLVCGTWDRFRDGEWALYDNGVHAAGGSGLARFGRIEGGGVLVLGQDQDTRRGGYAAHQGLSGLIAYFSMWSRVLTPTELDGIYNDCVLQPGGFIHVDGGLFPWGVNSIDINEVKGNAEMVCNTQCGM
ncbi:neuronal pentraxin-2-like [Glandiceps talaboti]